MFNQMRKRLLELVPLKPGEGLITTIMFLYIFATLTFYYILKPMRSSFFLKNLPSSRLPFAYILTAIFAGTLTTLVFKFSRRLSVIGLITLTNLAVIGTLFYFRSVMGRPIWYLPYVWFVYLQIMSVLLVSQFWLLAGFIYDNRQAKRIYGLLGAGAIAGSIAGSFVPAFLSKSLTTNTKLFLSVGICVVLTTLAHVAWRFRRQDAELPSSTRRFEELEDRLSDLLRLVFGSRHLILMVLLVFLTLIASQITEWQVNSALDDSFQGLPTEEKEDRIDEYWGRFYFWTNILGIALQLTITGFVVSRFGIGAAILFLPGSLFLASLGVILAPGLWTTTLALGSNNVFRYSINRAGFELLYLPLTPTIRKKLKLFVDVFMDRFGRAIAALVILTFTSVRNTAATAILLTALSIVVCVALRKAYVGAFRQQLTRREVDLTEISRYVTDPASVRMLAGALESAQERQILYSLRLLQSARDADFAQQLLPLLKHPSPYVREEAARTLPAARGDFAEAAEKLLADESEGVRLAAIEYLCSADPSRGSHRLQALLESENIDIRIAAARCAADSGQAAVSVSQKYVRNLLAVEGPRSEAARVAAARLSARLESAESVSLLSELMRERAPEVVAASMHAAAAAGHLDLVFEIIQRLTERKLRGAAREALLSFGQRITGTLGDVLADPKCTVALRREIPWILARIPTGKSADILMENLVTGDTLLKYRIVKALNRLHETRPEALSARPVIAERIHAETRAYYEALAVRQSFGAGDASGAGKLLDRALQERLDQNLEIIFRLLGLQYPQKDIYFAYAALKSTHAERRTAAIEFLDNLLHKTLKSMILPLLEESSADRLLDRASRLFGIQRQRPEEALRTILEQSDTWLKACALYEVGEKQLKEFFALCEKLSLESDPLIRETAEWALKRCA